jgi:hypothetical protein
MVRRATLWLGGTMPGSCATRIAFSSPEAISAGRASRSCPAAQFGRLFKGSKGVRIQITAPRPVKKWLCLANKGKYALSCAGAARKTEKCEMNPRTLTRQCQIELLINQSVLTSNNKNAKRTHRSDAYIHFPSYLHEHTASAWIHTNLTRPRACIIGERQL